MISAIFVVQMSSIFSEIIIFTIIQICLRLGAEGFSDAREIINRLIGQLNGMITDFETKETSISDEFYSGRVVTTRSNLLISSSNSILERIENGDLSDGS